MRGPERDLLKFHSATETGPKWLSTAPLKKSDCLIGHIDPDDYIYSCKVIFCCTGLLFEENGIWNRIDYSSIENVIGPSDKVDPLSLSVFVRSGNCYRLVTEEAYGIRNFLDFCRSQYSNYFGIRLPHEVALFIANESSTANLSKEEFVHEIISAYFAADEKTRASWVKRLSER